MRCSAAPVQKTRCVWAAIVAAAVKTGCRAVLQLGRPFSRPAIAISPVGTLGTCFACWIVNALFMGTADESINHRYALHLVVFNKIQDLLVDEWIQADIGRFRKPFVQKGDLIILFRGDDANDNLRRERSVGAVIRNGREGIPGLPAGTFLDPIPGIAVWAHKNVFAEHRSSLDRIQQ